MTALPYSLPGLGVVLPPKPGTAGEAAAQPPLPTGWWRALPLVHYINFGMAAGAQPRLQLELGEGRGGRPQREVLVAFEDPGDAAFVAGTLRENLLNSSPEGAGAAARQAVAPGTAAGRLAPVAACVCRARLASQSAGMHPPPPRVQRIPGLVIRATTAASHQLLACFPLPPLSLPLQMRRSFAAQSSAVWWPLPPLL
jgi:hypothetical protein